MSQDPHRTGSSQPVVHVRDNSDSELEALFKVAMNPQHVPFRERKLPASFFKEPQKHDNIYSPSSGINSQLTIAHNRAHSSPASLQQTLSAAPQQPPPSQHMRQHSCDNTLTEQPLPPGWEMAATAQGQRYYMNHLTQSTTWEDPRKALISPSRSQSNITSQTSPPQSQHSPNISLQNLSSLPAGWEQAVTPDGEVYYINHMEKLTSWFDPRIPPHLQRPNLRVPNAGQSQPPPPNSQPGQPLVSSAGSASQVSPPGQSQRQMSPSVGGGGQGQGQGQAQMQQLQRLQLEKQKLAKKQEELARQEMLLRAKLPQNSPSPMQSEQANQEGQTTEMTTVADPFLGQTGTSEVHSRQESSDSGLGGMGTSYSLPRTPEDFLGNMEDMDTQDGGHQKIGEFNNMDIGNMGDNPDNQNMDGDELVPSLQEDISNELLNDVESVLNSNKMDNLLTWL